MKIEAGKVRGVKEYPDPTDPDAIDELGEGFETYAGLENLLAAELRDERRAQGYGKVTGKEVTDKMLREALRRAVGQ